jgi:hypothetical protein
MLPAKKANRSERYEHVLISTDDALVGSENSEHVVRNGIGKYFKLMHSIGPSKLYLGQQMGLVEPKRGAKGWASSSLQ